MLLEGKKGLVLNVSNNNSIGWGIVEALHQHGATIAVGAQNEKFLGKVEKLIEGQERLSAITCDFSSEEDLSRLHDEVKARFGKIDFFVHAAAFADREDLQNRFIETSRAGFNLALEVSAYSLVAACRTLEPLFNEDASIVTLSYIGSTRAAANYNVMGVAKAALESAVRYLAVDLGDRGIRVNTLSPGPINTLSARGVKGLAEKIRNVEEYVPLKRPFGQHECGLNAVYLCSELSSGITGQIIYLDSGFNFVMK
ncbi:enoyl-ACP reductase [Armatimonadetes bacterium Uphvl-Ar1]|nr:enoyl-ACP reductase [Armatimonadetes bacterium Uphvl-Ar1]